jgi:predicted transport protein
MTTVEQGIESQLRNIEKAYGRTIDELVAIVLGSGLAKHSDVVAMLKQRYGMAHAAAHRVSLVARKRAAQPAEAGAFAPAMKDVYVLLLERIAANGDDIEQAPKKGYVSLRRRKQFAMVQPGAKWINLGLVLPKHHSTARLEPAGTWNALFTHRVRIGTTAEIDDELESWIRAAYVAAG